MAINDQAKVPIAILMIPLINAVADVTTNLFPSASINPGNARAMILILIMCWFSLRKKLLTKLHLPILVFLGYVLTTVLNTSDVSGWFMNYMKLALTFCGFMLGYWFIDTTERLERFNRFSIAAMGIICLNFVLSNVFKLGVSFYAEDTLYMGGAGANITPNLALIVLVGPLMLYTTDNRWRKFVRSTLIAISILFVILTLRRSALLALSGGILVYGFFSPQKKRAIYLVALGLVGFLVLSLVFQDAFEQRLAARTVDKHSLQNEARYNETFVVIDEFLTKGLQHALFGSEMFNSVTYFGGRRGLHVDYNIILHGSGIVGLLLYLLIYLIIVRRFQGISSTIRRDRFAAEIKGVFYALVTASLLISFSKGLLSIGLRMTFFMFAGALIAIIKNRASNRINLQTEIPPNQ